MSKGWADGKNQSKIINPKSADGKRMENMVNKLPALKKLRATSRGDSYSEITTAGDISEEYKNNYDKIVWTKPDEKEKPKFRTKVNGKYTDED